MDPISSLAASIASRAHAGQYDKAGQPYIEHVRRVSTYVDPTDSHAVAAAWLHDTIEDSPIDASELAAEGIPPQVVEVVELLTRRDDQHPDDYYDQIRRHPLARQVKLADLADNNDPDRLAKLPETQRHKLLRKYAHAYHALGADTEDGNRRRSHRHHSVPS